MKVLKRSKTKKIDTSDRNNSINELLQQCKDFVDKTEQEHKKFNDKPRQQVRQLLSLELRLYGYSYRMIGEILNVSMGTSHRDVKLELERQRELKKETIEDVREFEVNRLDRIMNKLLKSIERGKIVRNEKGNILFDSDNKPIFTLDHRSIEQVLKVMKRRSDLMGLDSPQQISIDDNRPIQTDSNERLLNILKRYTKNESDNNDQTIH